MVTPVNASDAYKAQSADLSQNIFSQLSTGTILVFNAAGLVNDSNRWGDVISYPITGSDTGDPVTFTSSYVSSFADGAIATFESVNGTFAPGVNGALFPVESLSSTTFRIASNCTGAASTGTAIVTIGNGDTDHPGPQAGSWPGTPYPMPLWPLMFPTTGGTVGDLVIRFSNSNTFGDRVSAALYDLNGDFIAKATDVYPTGTGGHKQVLTFDQADMPQACLVAIQCWQVSDGAPGSAKLSTLQNGPSLFGIGGGNIGYSTSAFQSSFNVPAWNSDFSATPFPAAITNVAGVGSHSYVSVTKPPAFYCEWTPA